MRKIFLAFIFLLTGLQGCGFHLRGDFTAPDELVPVYVRGGPRDEVAAKMREILQQQNIALARSPDQARSQIRLFKERFGDRVLSVDGQGKVIERELIYQVEFDVLDGTGAELVARQNLVVTRSQVNPEVEVLGKQEEAELLKEDMVQDLCGRILTRIRALLR